MTAPDRFDVAVIGGGAAGVAAALEAASLGASVALVESARPGGSCVHHTCIPTTILLESAAAFVAAREAAVAGIFTAGETLQLGRANDRAAALVRQLGAGVETALRRARVTVIQGRAAFKEPGLLEVSGAGPLAADAVVIAAGCAWEPPAIPGLAPERLVTPDVVQTWREAPAGCLVLGGGPSGGLFAIEYAVLLALAGSAVTLAAPGPLLCPGFDDDLQPFIADLLAATGVTARAGLAPRAADGREIRLAGPGGEGSVEADVVLAADPRVPSLEGLGIERTGLQPQGGAIPVDAACATAVPGIYAAGDVTGSGMLSSTAALQGRVAGANAAGDRRVARLAAVPLLVHAVPPLAAVGTRPADRPSPPPLASATLPIEGSAWSAVQGAAPGLVRLHADARTGELLSVQAIGPGAHEIAGIAGVLIQAEATLDQLAAGLGWHPAPAELLVEAARRAAAQARMA